MGYITPKQVTPDLEIGKMSECVTNAFGSHKLSVLKLLQLEKEGNNNNIVVNKYEEILSDLDSLCDSFVQYINSSSVTFDYSFLYRISVVLHVLESYLRQLNSSLEQIKDVFPLEIQEDDSYLKEIERINRLISIINNHK